MGDPDLDIMPTLGLCNFLALWRGGIMVREVIRHLEYVTIMGAD